MAQATAGLGSITGTVRDASGAVVRGAKVVVSGLVLFLFQGSAGTARHLHYRIGGSSFKGAGLGKLLKTIRSVPAAQRLAESFPPLEWVIQGPFFRFNEVQLCEVAYAPKF